MRCLKVVRNQNGNVMPLTLATVVVIFLIMAVLFEFYRLNTIMRDVDDALQATVQDVAMDNVGPSIESSREGYSAGLQYDKASADWASQTRKGAYSARLARELGLTSGQVNGQNALVKMKSNALVYYITDIIVTFDNPTAAPESTTSRTLKVRIRMTVSIPMSTGIQSKGLVITRTSRAYSHFQQKF